jgi:hypothetical protein
MVEVTQNLVGLRGTIRVLKTLYLVVIRISEET